MTKLELNSNGVFGYPTINYNRTRLQAVTEAGLSIADSGPLMKTTLNQAISADMPLAKDRTYNADSACRTPTILPFLNWDEHF